MKIIGIQSSPRGKNSNTLKLLEAAMEGARQAGAETEIIDITKLKINYCKGDLSCFKTGKCAQKDDFELVEKKMIEADGIILSSPNYINNVTGQMKTFLDRMANVIHEQLLDGKYGFSIVTAGGSGDEFVLNLMNTFLVTSGADSIGGISYLISHGPAEMDAAVKRSGDLGKELVEAIKEKRRYPEQDKIHASWRKNFSYTIIVNKDRWAHNYEYWLKKGWIKP